MHDLEIIKKLNDEAARRELLKQRRAIIKLGVDLPAEVLRNIGVLPSLQDEDKEE